MRRESWIFALIVLPTIGAHDLGAGTAAGPRHFVFFGTDRHRIQETSFLETKAFAGAQLKYTWRELEPARGAYDFSEIEKDLEFLQEHGKGMFLQLQDVSFSVEIVNVPAYLLEDTTFAGGVARQYTLEGDDDATATPEGWVARRWDPQAQKRFVLLLQALGDRLDGRIEGINLPETAVEFGVSGRLHPEGFSYDAYVQSVQAILSAARQAFPTSHVIQYANFMPGEWLPWTDNGYLKAVYAHANEIGAGVGGPDLLPFRKGQLNHSYPLIAARDSGIVAGVAVQWGNFEDRNPKTGEPITVEELVAFARRPLRLDYVFWGTQEPYYSQQVIPFLRGSAHTER